MSSLDWREGVVGRVLALHVTDGGLISHNLYILWALPGVMPECRSKLGAPPLGVAPNQTNKQKSPNMEPLVVFSSD